MECSYLVTAIPLPPRHVRTLDIILWLYPLEIDRDYVKGKVIFDCEPGPVMGWLVDTMPEFNERDYFRSVLTLAQARLETVVVPF